MYLRQLNQQQISGNWQQNMYNINLEKKKKTCSPKPYRLCFVLICFSECLGLRRLFKCKSSRFLWQLFKGKHTYNLNGVVVERPSLQVKVVCLSSHIRAVLKVLLLLSTNCFIQSSFSGYFFISHSSLWCRGGGRMCSRCWQLFSEESSHRKPDDMIWHHVRNWICICSVFDSRCSQREGLLHSAWGASEAPD